MRQDGEMIPAKKAKRKMGGVLIGLIVAVILMGTASVGSFSHYLNKQLFLERQTHLLEITEKVAEVIDVVINSAWGSVGTCEKLLMDAGDVDQDQLLEDLIDMNRFVQSEDSVILAFDETASYYSSDGQIGHWGDPSVFLPSKDDRQVVIASLPYKDINDVYLVFIQRLEQAVMMEDAQITHVAVAVGIDMLKDAFAVSAFSDTCYTFIVNNEGRRLYKNTQLSEFIDGYNILTAMEPFEFINGGTIEDLKGAVGNEKKACLEFIYDETNYFVGTSFVPSVNWEVMLFVPTDVLGANTNELLNRTSQYFLVIGAAALVLLGTVWITISVSHNDKKLMMQQQESNILLEKAATEAQKANQAKSQFLSHMSHDIRTPINGIMGMTDIALKQLDDRERTEDCLKKIDTASRHLLSLVNDVLDMSSIESGKTEINHEKIDMRAVLGNCASIIGGQLTDRKLTFIKEFAEFKHPNLLGDELRLRQVLINILGNAVKFTPDGGTIRFCAEELAMVDQSAIYRFVIEDNGIGMKESFLKHIFEPFSQEDGKDRSTYTGTGLGMAITKQFVDLMGGNISVESKPGEGSKFTLEIPFEITEETVTVKEEDCSFVDVAGMKVLLVEDNELNQEIARCILEEKEVLVSTADNGQEAVEKFSQNPPGTFDLILMDVMMPVMDGMTAVRTIRSLPREDAREIPIIAMTANAYEEDKKRTREAGMNEHLSKPINGYVLFEALGRYYRRKTGEGQI